MSDTTSTTLHITSITSIPSIARGGGSEGSASGRPEGVGRFRGSIRRAGSGRIRILVLAGSLCLACGVAEPEPGSQLGTPAGDGRIERLEAGLDALVAPGARIEKLAEGFRFTEGPVWVDGPGGGHLLFSDIPENTIYRWSEGQGSSVFLRPVMPPDADTGGTGGANGLLLDPRGRVVLFEHGNRQVSRIESDGTRSVLADRYRGLRLNSPNDGVYHSSGALYFTDPPYGLEHQDRDVRKELPWNGIYRLTPGGALELLEDGQSRPNGIGLSPDERTLYVANSAGASGRLWMAYPIHEDGTLGPGRVFFDADDSHDGGSPDGLAVDTRGNLWAAGPGGILVLSPEGRHLGTLRLPELPSNAAFGEDGRTLYMTARSAIYRIPTRVRGL